MKKIKKMNQKFFGVIDVIIIVIITGIITGLTTGLITYNSNPVKYTDLSDNEAIKEFLEVYASVITDYYETVDEKELINSAINGMFNYLGDDYTTYMNKEQSEQLADKLSGEYEGIGIQISSELEVVKVFDNTPASKAGIKEGDFIVNVAETNVDGKTSAEVASMIKKSSGDIKIILKRDNKEMTVSVKVATIDYPSVTSELIEKDNKKIGYIYIDAFSKTLPKQMETTLKKLEEQGMESLILDVRGNTGGYLNAAQSTIELFLEKGKVIYSLEDKSSSKTVKDTTPLKKDYKIVVLTNKSSASASEILAAALKESYGAILVGETTFGKGKVQQTMDLTSGGMVKYTSSKWLTPNGKCIDGLGYVPDIELAADYSKQPKLKKEDDEAAYEKAWLEYSEYLNDIAIKQKEKAIEILLK